jgi:hypothetical protein
MAPSKLTFLDLQSIVADAKTNSNAAAALKSERKEVGNKHKRKQWAGLLTASLKAEKQNRLAEAE